MIYFLKTGKGFTLIEMLVVISIFTIMTGVVLANLPNFRERTALQLVAQKMSLTIREAQVYGVGVKSFGADFPSHGIHFDPIIPNGKKSYVLFADKLIGDATGGVKNDYDSAPTNELVTKYDLIGTVEIEHIDLCNSGTPPSCTLRDSNGLNIVFDRPKTEAQFTIPGTGVSFPVVAPSVSASYAQITIKSSRSGEQRFIQVWNTGQISVKTSLP